MRAQRDIYKTQRALRDVQVVTGPDGVARYGRRLARRQVTRRVLGPVQNRMWRAVWKAL